MVRKIGNEVPRIRDPGLGGIRSLQSSQLDINDVCFRADLIVVPRSTAANWLIASLSIASSRCRFQHAGIIDMTERSQMTDRPSYMLVRPQFR
jgi:hypothetical protein